MFSIFFSAALSIGVGPGLDSLKPLAPLIGTWKGAASMETGDKTKWTETLDVSWKFAEKESLLVVKFTDSKLFSEWEVRSKEKRFELTAKFNKGPTVTYEGELKEKQLILERTEKETVERLVVNLLHDNRMTYRLEDKKKEGTLFTKRILTGMTKEGVPFVEIGKPERECIVSGGLGTMTVTHEGKTYYVCCSGCRDEFKRDPAFYVKEWEKKNKPK